MLQFQGAAPASRDSTKIALVRAFDEAFAVTSGLGWASATNDEGLLSWSQSYLMNALLDVYVATGRRTYLETFVAHADSILGNIDTVRGVADYRGVVRPGWSTTKYSNNRERAHWIVDDAMILEPLLHFALLVQGEEDLRRAYGSVAEQYIRVAEEVMAGYDSLFRIGPGGESGQYLIEAGAPTSIGSPDKPNPVPVNWNTAAGTVHLLLCRLTGDANHCERARLLALWLRSELEVVSDRYAWRYWGADGRAIFHPNWDDIAHGAISVRFAAFAAQAGPVFDSTDLGLFKNALLYLQIGEDFLPYLQMAPSDTAAVDMRRTRGISHGSALWLPLGRLGVYRAIKQYILAQLGTGERTHPVVLAGLAGVIRWYDAMECKGADAIVPPESNRRSSRRRGMSDLRRRATRGPARNARTAAGPTGPGINVANEGMAVVWRKRA